MTARWFTAITEWWAAMASLFVFALLATIQAASGSLGWLLIAALSVGGLLVELTWPRAGRRR